MQRLVVCAHINRFSRKICNKRQKNEPFYTKVNRQQDSLSLKEADDAGKDAEKLAPLFATAATARAPAVAKTKPEGGEAKKTRELQSRIY